jgi:hypothetical protein
MRRLIIAGLVYLTGIAVILLIKPQYMFREDGRWKEFGIGRDPEYFTHIPFWLFAIVWAIISYLTVAIIENSFYGNNENNVNNGNNGNNEVSESGDTNHYPPRQNTARNSRNSKTSRNSVSKEVELTPGYYMLNESATGRNGVPRYVYLGPESPVYNAEQD